MSFGKKLTVAFLITFLLSLSGFAGNDPALGQQLKNSWLGDAERVRLDNLRAEGLKAMYNLDYETARRRFKEMTQAFPNHPAGPQHLAASIWLQTLHESRRLQGSLYTVDVLKTKSEGQADPRIVEQFRAWTKQAKQLSEARLKTSPRDAEALYFLGATEALKAGFTAAVERRYISALRDGSRSIDLHRDTLKVDPNFHDAEITIGLYDYVLGGLPLPIKVLASLTGMRGSKRRGIETLQRVAAKGTWARDDAKVLLLGIFKIEERFADALALSRELAAKYPRNYLFHLESADALIWQAARARAAAVGGQTTVHAAMTGGPANAPDAEREALQMFEGMLRDPLIKDEARLLDLVHFRYGEALLTLGQPERAAKEFLAAAAAPGAEPNLATLSRLQAGRGLDLAGRRREALTQYQAVLSRPDTYDAHQQARRGLREPYQTKNR